MCLAVPARVVNVTGGTADVQLHGEAGSFQASTDLAPETRAGDYVLVDRGMILRVIDKDEADTLLAIYSEMGELLDEPEIMDA